MEEALERFWILVFILRIKNESRALASMVMGAGPYNIGAHDYLTLSNKSLDLDEFEIVSHSHEQTLRIRNLCFITSAACALSLSYNV